MNIQNEWLQAAARKSAGKRKASVFSLLVFSLFSILPFLRADTPAMSAQESAVLEQIQALNRIPEDELDDKQDPTLSILRKIIDLDGPEYLSVRKLTGQAAVRGPLTPGTRAVLAGLVSPRWDAYNVAGSLWLAALRTTNPALRDKAQRKMEQFIQPTHIPQLILYLKTPATQAVAYDILKDATGQALPPDASAWTAWWNQNKTRVDLIGVLLGSVKAQLLLHPISTFGADRLWYVPDGIRDKAMPFEKRTPQEQELLRRWNDWANTNVHQYVDEWAAAKPILEKVTHHPDPRVNTLLEALLQDPSYGDYAAIVLAWRQSKGSLQALESSYTNFPTVGRALAMGSLGERQALVYLLQMIDHSGVRALSYGVMEDDLRALVPNLKSVGVLPAEDAFELLCHRSFGFTAAETGKEKRKRFEKARDWLKTHAKELVFDPRRGYFTTPKN